MNTYGATRRFHDYHLDGPLRITLMAVILALGLVALGVGLHRTSAQTPPANRVVLTARPAAGGRRMRVRRAATADTPQRARTALSRFAAGGVRRWSRERSVTNGTAA